MKGRVKFFSRNKGFGFIIDDSGVERYFNDNHVIGDLPRKGELVEFEATDGGERPQADEVSVVVERMPQNTSCPNCQALGVPRIYRRNEFMMNPTTEHICAFCGEVMYETGGGFQTSALYAFWMVLWTFSLMMVDYFCFNSFFNPDFFVRENFFIVPMLKISVFSVLWKSLPYLIFPLAAIFFLRIFWLERRVQTLTLVLAFVCAATIVFHTLVDGDYTSIKSLNTNFLWSLFNAFFLWIVIYPSFHLGDILAERFMNSKIFGRVSSGRKDSSESGRSQAVKA